MAHRIAKRVLLIGWDAADWQLIQPLLERGQMPTLASLMRNGVSGNLATLQPMLSPMLWTSIATGKRADRHGICGFVEPKPDETGIQPVSSTSRNCKAIWNILSQNDLRSIVVSWFASHPAEQIKGAVVTDRYAAQAPAGQPSFPKGTFHPDHIAQPLSDLFVTPQLLDAEALLPFVPKAAQIDQDNDDRLVKLAVLIAQAASVQAATCHLLKTEPWDFAGVYFSAIDHFGHHFMPYHPPCMGGVSPRDAEIYGEVMNSCYRFHDMMLAALLATAGEDAAVMLVSDHGFLSGATRPGANAWEDPEQWHRPFGVGCIAGPGIRRGETLYGATLLDVTPTILTLLGLPVAEDMDGRAWLEVLEQPVRQARIPSWEDVPGDAGLPSPDAAPDSASSAEMIQRLVELGYLEPPSEDAQKAVRKARRDSKVNLALAMSQSRRAGGAVTLWKELAAEYPEEEGMLVQIVLCYLRLGRMGLAGQTLEQMSDELRSEPVVRLLDAAVALSRGEPDKAVEISRAALAGPSANTALLNRAGEIFLQTQHFADAERTFRQALAADDDNPIAHDGLAQVHLARSEAQSAAEHALAAVGLMHYFPAAHQHLGQALRQLGENAEAIAAFETCLQMGWEPRDMHIAIADLCEATNPKKAASHRATAQRMSG